MPHSLYLGSGIVQPRLLDYDIKNGHVETPAQDRSESPLLSEKQEYQPSLAAIKFCLKYSIFELAISLFTFALFINSAILIVAGSFLSADQLPDLFGVDDLLSRSIGQGAATVFALALLLSGISAGIVCTIAGQMVSEGALNWSLAPWLRRLITRSISITPSIIIAGAVGQDGLTTALNASQNVLSVVLPFVSAPLIYFTCRNKFMSVKVGSSGSRVGLRAHDNEENGRNFGQNGGSPPSIMSESDSGMGMQQEDVKMRNHWVTAALAVLIWLIIVTMNIANLVLTGMGRSG
jgi:metal iron transporter